MDMEAIERDLAIFSDLGTKPPTVFPMGDRTLVRMFRGGIELEVEFHEHGRGRVIERLLDEHIEHIHASYKALLASERFANLRKWAESQQVVLEHLNQDMDNRLPVFGQLSEDGHLIGPEEFDQILVDSSAARDAISVMLIDGPAGIGKTRFIELLCFQRARNYIAQQRPLILHVESRGRVMTFIQDLIAYSLQRMRLPVTFDQIPILVRHELVTLAIDGFDELGDPSGYAHAWAQLNDLMSDVRGGGTVILAGRDTFIGPERIKRDIKALRTTDTVNALSLKSPRPDEARRWLAGHGWTQADLQSVEELFEAGSYALRPFFLAQLAHNEVASAIKTKTAGIPLAFLVDLMISREVTKFGDVVEGVMAEDERYAFVRGFLREAARFMGGRPGGVY